MDLGNDGGLGQSQETGPAAVGQTTNDFWNFYDVNSSPTVVRNSGTVTNLELANGSSTPIGVNVSDAPGSWFDSSADPMYHTYIYPLDGGNDVVTFTNLPTGQYDVLAYSPDGNFDLTSGGSDYGVKVSADPNVTTIPVWTEGVQYARWRNVQITNGQPLVLTVMNGAMSGNALLCGIQIISSSISNAPAGPQIIDQPTNETVLEGSQANFSVTASGSGLTYQWYFDATNIVWATNATLTLTNVQLDQAGIYTVGVSNAGGSIVSSNAVLTVLAANYPTNEFLLNLDLGPDNGMGQPSQKTGFAAVGLTTNDFWNFYDNDVGKPAVNMERSDKTPTSIGVNVSDAGGNWGDYSTDPMYRKYVYPLDGGNDVLTFTNLPTGQYDVLAYSPDGNFNLAAGGTDYGMKTSADITVTTTVEAPVWTEGVQYARWRNVQVTNGQPLVLTVRDGALGGNAVLCGVQIIGNSISNPPAGPQIIEQPTNESVTAGQMTTLSVVAIGTQPLFYQWTFDSNNIPNATNATFSISNVQFTNAGTYAVVVSNIVSSILSSNAVLTVTPPPCVSAPSGLVGWWRAEGDTSDSSGYQNNATNVQDITYTNGEVGEAFVFDGSTSLITIPPSQSLTVTNITMEAWVYPTDNQTPRPIIDFGGPGQLSPAHLWINTTGFNSVIPGGIHAIFNTPATLEVDCPTDVVITNQWNHIAFTVNTTTGVGIVYCNGIEVASNSISGTGTPQTFVNVNIGYRDVDSLDGLAGSRFLGYLDEVSIYNRALSSNEVTAIYHAGASGKCFAPTLPSIVTQPTNQTVFVGQTVAFNVSAMSTVPLSYQWTFDNTNIIGATNSTFDLPNAQLTNTGTYAVVVSNYLQSIVSSNALLTVLTTSYPTNGFLVNLDLGPYNGTSGSLKRGFAAMGLATNDFWNFYDNNITPGVARYSGTVTNLELSDGTPTPIGVHVSDAPGNWGDNSTDSMYQTYVYPLDGGNDVVTFTNLPTGQYDVLAYSPDGNFDLTSGGSDYGVKVSADPNVTTIPVWTEGVQYARWRDVQVTNGLPLVLTVRHGALGGKAVLCGVQIISTELIEGALDHFSWGTLPSIGFVNTPIPVTIQAMNEIGGIVSNFDGTVGLSSTNAIPIEPQQSVNFTNGLWTGFVTVGQPATNLVLQANDLNGHLGDANAITIMPLPMLESQIYQSYMLINWPTTSSNFELETTVSLSPPNWVPVTTPPLVFDGENLQILPMTSTNQFYRLEYIAP